MNIVISHLFVQTWIGSNLCRFAAIWPSISRRTCVALSRSVFDRISAYYDYNSVREVVIPVKRREYSSQSGDNMFKGRKWQIPRYRSGVPNGWTK